MGIFLCTNYQGGTQSVFPCFTVFTGGPANNFNTTEANRQTKAYVSGTFSGLGVAVDANGTGRTWITRKGGANGNLAPSIPDSTLGAFFDTTNSDTVSIGDLWNYDINGPNTTTWEWAVMQFVASSGHVALYNGSLFSVSSNGVSYNNIDGTSLGQGGVWPTEPKTQFSVRVAGTWANISVHLQSNTLVGITTVNSRKNGANGSQSFTIPAASGAGIFDDGGATSDSVASGDFINVAFDTTASASGNAIGCSVGSTITATSGSASDMFVPGNGASRTASASVHFQPPIGMCNAWSSTTETIRQQVQPNIPFTVKNFRCKALTNSYTGSCTVTLRKNGADVITLTIPAGSTSEVEDTSTTVSFIASDNFDLSVTGGTSGALVFQYLAYILDTSTQTYTLMGQNLC